MIAEAIMVFAMTSGAGYGAVGSESITSFESMETCMTAIRAFRSTRGAQSSVVNRSDGVKFTEEVEWGHDRHYTLTCVELEKGSEK